MSEENLIFHGQERTDHFWNFFYREWVYENQARVCKEYFVSSWCEKIQYSELGCDGLDWILDIRKIEAKTTWTWGQVLSNSEKLMQEKIDINFILFMHGVVVLLFQLYMCVLILIFNKDCVFLFH